VILLVREQVRGEQHLTAHVTGVTRRAAAHSCQQFALLADVGQQNQQLRQHQAQLLLGEQLLTAGELHGSCHLSCSEVPGDAFEDLKQR
jgi:hypothetical protein